MRMILPTQRDRLRVDSALRAFFTSYREADFRRAIRTVCGFYNLKMPTVEWFEYLDWGKGAGRTFDNGCIHLVHPENWKKGRKYNSMKQWVLTVHHEMGHYLLWTDAERKADIFAAGMMQGTNHTAPRARPTTRVRLTGSRQTAGGRSSR